MSLSQKDIGIWLINLPGDLQRRERMQGQLAEMGMVYTLFEAIDGRVHQTELMRNASREAYARNMGTPLLPGKLGVYASHMAVWKALVASPHKAALVLEDDVVFHSDFPVALATALNASEHWDLVRFNAIRAKLPVRQRQLGSYSLNAYIGPFTGNACYLLHRELAAKLLTQLLPQTRSMDHELNRFFFHNYRQLGLEPFSSHPDDGGQSTITGKNFALVNKPKWYKRIPYYRLKTANYFRRFNWLAKQGMLWPRH